MRVLVDTNILFSAILRPNSKPAQVISYLTDYGCMVLCDQNISEFRDIIKRKIPEYQLRAEKFLTNISYELIPAVYSSDNRIRDASDEPILNAAILSDVDIIVTGDKDFLSLKLERPKCLTAAEFLEYIEE